jgi:LPS sulfotransferase NodH
MPATAASSPPAPPTEARPPRDWSARLCEGMTFSGWRRLLKRNHYAVDPEFRASVRWINFISLVNSAYRRAQLLERGLFLRKATVKHPPIFILGHWRSGTTLLHEVLVLDARHTSPNSYQCFAPHHFVVTSWFAYRFLKFLLPSKRPMDNMAMGWKLPQEDEFALANLGLPSTYLDITFPKGRPHDPEYLTLEGVPPEDLERWKQTLWRFLRNVNYQDPRRIVLKSPPHTARVRVLREMFPDAKFVHITRDPYVVFPSTVNLWTQLNKRHGLQHPQPVGLDEYVFDNFERMYRRFELDRATIPESHLVDVRYEDLIQDPVAQVARVYEQLELGGFDELEPKLTTFWSGQADYRTNRYAIDEATRTEVQRRWGPWMRKYGYDA